GDMRKELQHYIDGEWVDSTGSTIIDVINPATEEVYGQIIDGTKEDLDKAVMAARKAFASFSQTSRQNESICYNELQMNMKSAKRISLKQVPKNWERHIS